MDGSSGSLTATLSLPLFMSTTHQMTPLQLTKPSIYRYSYRTHCYGNDISLNDVVLFETLFNDDDEPWAYVNYNEDEVRQLKLRGVKIPDCLPENLSRGNCG